MWKWRQLVLWLKYQNQYFYQFLVEVPILVLLPEYWLPVFFTDFGIGTNTGIKYVWHWYWYRYQNTGWEIERPPILIPRYRFCWGSLFPSLWVRSAMGLEYSPSTRNTCNVSWSDVVIKNCISWATSKTPYYICAANKHGKSVCYQLQKCACGPDLCTV
jgi:hypothetical protein